MITENTIRETRDRLDDICKDWDKTSDDYRAVKSAAIYLNEFMQFLIYIKGTDAARSYGNFIIDNETYDSNEW